MAERLIYERETPHRYTIENGYERRDGMGGLVIKQGFEAHFKAMSDVNLTSEFDATRAAERYADNEVMAGRVDYKDRDRIFNERLERIKSFIESHEHYTRPGGLGLIWKKKSEAQIIAEREASIMAQIEALEEMKRKVEGVQSGEVSVEEALEEELPEVMTNAEGEVKRGPGRPKKDELVKPVGVVAGVATSNTLRGK